MQERTAQANVVRLEKGRSLPSTRTLPPHAKLYAEDLPVKHLTLVKIV